MKNEYDFTGGRRGAVLQVGPNKTRTTIRLDDDVLDWFRTRAEAAGDGNYQTMINQALREHIVRQEKPREDLLERPIRSDPVTGAWLGSSHARVAKMEVEPDDSRKPSSTPIGNSSANVAGTVAPRRVPCSASRRTLARAAA